MHIETVFHRPTPTIPNYLLGTLGGSSVGISKIQTYRQCPRKAALDAMGLGRDKSYLDVGTLGHVGMAHLLAHRELARGGVVRTGPGGQRLVMGQDTLPRPLEAMREFASLMGYTPEVVKIAMESMSAYIGRASDIPSHVRVLGVEVEMATPVTWAKTGEVWYFTAIADSVLYDPMRNQVEIEDHKFLANVTSASVAAYDLSLQFYGLRLHAAHAFGDRGHGGVLVRAFDKDKYTSVRRLTLQHSATLSVVGEQIAGILRERAAWFQRGPRDPMLWPAALSGGTGSGCYGKYGLCSGHSICTGGLADLSALRHMASTTVPTDVQLTGTPVTYPDWETWRAGR